ncbi:transcription elongation factor Spt5 [Desulfurococcaceae archaeon MEX13E-LK6-19]|nr:transcription elongation factor Spt5 [Desulfurococcaceae archaeon MEX13E-LK6-19]
MSNIVKKKPSVYYAVRTTAGREIDVALIMENRAHRMRGEIDVRSIIVPPEIKGYVIVEAPGIHVVYPLVKEIKYVKGKAPGIIKAEEIEKLVKPKPVIEMVKEGDIVEVIAGPFRGMKARVVSVDRNKNEVVLNILEAEFPLPITVPADFVKPVKSGE